MGMSVAQARTVAFTSTIVHLTTRPVSIPRWTEAREVTGVMIGATRLTGGTPVLCVLCPGGRLEAVPIAAIVTVDGREV